MHSGITQTNASAGKVQAKIKSSLLMLFILLTGFSAFAQPANDNPCNATPLTVEENCNFVNATNVGATASPGVPAPGCASYGGGDVWFSFVVPAGGTVIVNSNKGTMTDGGMALYRGTCTNLTLIDCNDDQIPGTNLMPRIKATGLTPGSTIWVRFWNYQYSNAGTFGICAALPPPPPTYISPCTAKLIPVTQSCNFTTFTNESAPGFPSAPAPGCASYNGADVWFKVVVPCEKRITFDSYQGDITDGAMAVYKGTCANLTLLQCDDDGSDNYGMPKITLTNLVEGDTLYVRFWSWNNVRQGSFGLCAAVPPPPPLSIPGLPPSPTCPQAQPLCMSPIPYTMPNVSGQQPTNFPGGGIYGCLIQIPNPTYYTLQIQNSGSVEFTISQTNNAGDGVDVDFVLWGPFTSPSACNQISASNIVDCSYSTDPIEVINIPNGIAGQYYVLLVTNYGNEAGHITYQQTGGTGSSACCTLNATNSGPVCASGALINLTSSSVPNANYQWTGPNCFTSTQQNPTGVATPTVPGTYVYTVTAVTPSGQICSDTTILTVTAAPSLGADKSVTVCSGSTVNLTTQYTTTGFTTQWTLSGQPVANPAAVTVSGDYQLVAALGTGCTDTAIVHVLIDTVNFATTPVNATCANNGTITVATTSGIAPYTYNINTAGNVYQASNVFSVPAGDYTIRTKDAQGCITSKTVTVAFTNDLVISSVPSVTICNGQSATLTATSSSNAATYTWSPATGLSSSTVLSPVANPTESTLYTLTAVLGSCTQTTQTQVNVSAGITVNAGPDITLVVEEKGSLIGAASGPVSSILWTPTTALSTPNSLATVVGPFTTAGTYTYTLAVQTALGCSANDQATVTVVPYCIKVKNAFTPNGDGNNDLWQVYDDFGCLKNVAVHVFNRYGGKVFESRDYRNNWDGRYAGKSLPDGTYYAVIDFTLITGKVVQIKTDLTILR